MENLDEVILQILTFIADSKVQNKTTEITSHPFLKAFHNFYNNDRDIIGMGKCSLDSCFAQKSESDCISVCFSRNYNDIDKMQTLVLGNIRINGKLRTILSYLLGELICNIQEHSEALKGFLSIERDRTQNKLFVCIADNGITIPGSYFLNNKRSYLDVIGSDSLEALRYSIRGLSTKDRPVSETRGYGISTNLNLVVNGMRGYFIVISGNTLYISSPGEERYMKLPEVSAFDGTMFLISLPLEISENFNLYNYIN